MYSFYNDDIRWISGKVENLLLAEKEKKPSEWAEKRYLDDALTDNPGPWDNSLSPYMVEIMDCFAADSIIKEVALMKPGQIGGSTGVLENVIGFIIDENPGPTLYLSGSDKLAKAGAEIKIDRLIESAGLSDKIKSPIKRKAKGRKSGDTAVRKDFPGGFLMILGAQTAANLKQSSIRTLLIDEVEEIPTFLKDQGDSITIAKVRLKAFDKTRKALYLSTPVAFHGPIHNLFLKGDQRKYYVPCPRCGFKQFMTFRGTREDEKKYGVYYEVDADFKLIYESVHYICANCLKFWEEKEKHEITNAGFWNPTTVAVNKYFRSYTLESLYSQFTRWTSVVEDWLECWSERHKKIVDVEKLRVFNNTQRGIPFEQRGDSATFEIVIKNRRQFYTINEIRNKVIVQETGSPILCLTAGVDVHKRFIFVEIKGWCSDLRSYSIDYRKLEGPVTDLSGASWKALEEIILNESWTADDGKKYRVNLTLIDASYETNFVYDFCRKYSNIFAVQGRGSPPGNARMREFDEYDRKGLTAYNVNVTHYKDFLSSWLRQDWNTGKLQPYGYCNFPEDYGDDFFREYTAEHKVKRVYRNKTTYLWEEKDKNLPNEAWDCGVYNAAAIAILCYLINNSELGVDAINFNLFWKYIADEKLFYSE